MSLVLRYAARSDRGLIRGNNQDSVYAGPRLLAVADGMGGHAAGDVASKVVIAALEHLDDDAPVRRHAAGDARGRLRGQRAPARGDPRVARSSRAWGRRSPRSSSPAAGWRCATSATPAPTCVRDGQLVADHPRRHVRADADRRRPDHRRGGQQPPAALAAAARAQRPGGRAGPLHARGPRRRPLPALLRRPVRRRQRGDPRRGAAGPRPAVHRRPADRAGAAQRRPRQRHRDRRRRHRGPGGRGAPVDPVVDGAAGGNVGQRQVDARSAAGRAALADPPPHPRRHPHRRRAVAPPPAAARCALLLVAVVVLVVLVAGAVGTYVWALRHWFVGVDGSGDDRAGRRLPRPGRLDRRLRPLSSSTRSTGLRRRRPHPGGPQPGPRRHHRRRRRATPTASSTPCATSGCPLCPSGDAAARPRPRGDRSAAHAPASPAAPGRATGDRDGHAEPHAGHRRRDHVDAGRTTVVVRAGGGLPGGRLMAGPVHRSPRRRGRRRRAPTRRGTEAALLGFAVLITVVAQCIVDLTITGSLRAGDGHASASGSPRCGWSPTSSSASGRPTPTRCCCPRSPCSVGLGPGRHPPARPRRRADRQHRHPRGRPGPARSGRPSASRCSSRSWSSCATTARCPATPTRWRWSAWRCWPCPRCCRRRSPRSTAPRSGSGSPASPSSPVSSPRSAWSSSSPPTWSTSATSSRWPAAG